MAAVGARVVAVAKLGSLQWHDTRMGYYLQAIMGTRQTLSQHAAAFRHANVVSLTQGIAMIPITDDLYDEIADDGESGRFEKLSPGVEKWTQEISTTAPVAYIEAEFWGGLGGQGAIVWSGGSRVLGPIHSQDAINQVLRFFGVSAGGAYDEFEAVELDRHRNTNDWIADAAP